MPIYLRAFLDNLLAVQTLTEEGYGISDGHPAGVDGGIVAHLLPLLLDEIAQPKFGYAHDVRV